MFSAFNVFLTQSSVPVIGQLAKLFGILMNGIYDFMGTQFGIYSLGLSIILFTIITRLLMLPLAFKQQKSMKEMQIIQPEIKAIQDKYKNKKDQASQQKMQAEMSALYQKHNVNPFGGCLPLLIQMPIIFSLYQVLRNIPAYIGNIRSYYEVIVSYITSVSGYGDKLATLRESDRLLQQVSNFDPENTNKVIDLLYKFQTSTWEQFNNLFPTISDQVGEQVTQLNDVYTMFGINLADKPDLMTLGVLIPVLNVGIQFLVTKTSMARANNGNAQANSTNTTMMYMMPFVSGFFATTLPAGLGLYWLAGSVFQLGQQLVINHHIHNDKDKNSKAQAEKADRKDKKK